MPLTVAAAFAVFLVLIVALFVLYTTYNLVVAMTQRIDKAWANVEVVLEQRHDELPNLVNAVRDVMTFEQGLLERVTALRAAWSREAPVQSQARTSEATSSAVRHLLGTIEDYPELKATENVSGLQAEIQRLEGMIAARRELYNDSVYRYNTTIAQVPGVAVAWLFGWRPREFFDAGPEADARPEVALRSDDRAN